MDGLEQQLDSVASNQYDELATSATANVALWPRPLVVFGGAKAMSALTDDQVRVLREAARASAEPNAGLNLAGEIEGVAQLCRRGRLQLVTATPGDLAGLRRATAPVMTWLRQDAVTSAALDRISALRATVTAEAPPSCAGVAGGSVTHAGPLGPRGPLDGTYVVDTTNGGDAASRRRTTATGSTWSTGAGSRSARRTARPAPGATGPGRSTAPRSSGCSPTAAGRPPTGREQARRTLRLRLVEVPRHAHADRRTGRDLAAELRCRAVAPHRQGRCHQAQHPVPAAVGGLPAVVILGS